MPKNGVSGRAAGGYSRNVDIVKDIAIIFMVLGHSGFPYSSFVYLFHMAVFFIASGLLWNSRNSQTVSDVWKYIRRKLKSLWIPYVLCNGFFVLTHNLFLSIGIYSDNPLFLDYVSESYGYGLSAYMSMREILQELLKTFCFLGVTQLGGATWFLRSLFVIAVGHCVLEYLIKKFCPKYRKAILSLVFVLCCLFYELVRIKVISISIDTIMSCSVGYVAYLIGIGLREMEWEKKQIPTGVKWVSIVVSFGFLKLMEGHGIINVNIGYVSSIMFYLFASLFGWIMLYFVADLIGEVNLGNGLRYIGQHSLPVVLLHFLSFKLVSAVYCLLTDNPMLLIAWYPSIKTSGNLWLYYGVVGVVVPIACYEVYIRAKKQVIGRT